MKAAISEVLETMYFAEVSFREEKAIPESFEGWRARIQARRSDGANSATLILWLSPHFAKELAGNLLALEPHEISEEDVKDAMGELANMVGGSWVKQLEPSEWRLGLPDAAPVDSQIAGAGAGWEMLSYGEPVGFAAVQVTEGS
ncbi:chemotaxis protein CheX [Desulfacinum hydrothermale]|nr:chemotaxis protein CheX [Desulfacinum hydrothermale]